jgi:hypothetical protein
LRDIRAARFTPTSFATDITRTPFVFVQVDPVIGRQFPMALIRHFDRYHEGRFSYGTLPRLSVRTPAWWTDNFRNSMGSLRHGVSDGTWLFESGLVTGYHAGPSALIDERTYVAYFEELVQRRLEQGGYSRASERQESPRHPTSPPAPSVEEPSPFSILGVPDTATDEQVRDAWREQMKLNHPDRVAHLSPALQKFALAQTMEVQRAYDAITRMRGGRR